MSKIKEREVDVIDFKNSGPSDKAIKSKKSDEDHFDKNYFGKEALTPVFFSKVPVCLLYTSPRPRDATLSRMPSYA